MEQNNDFAKIIRKGLVNKGWKQKDLAKALGVAEVTVSRYISGCRTPGIHTFFKICNLLNLDVKEAFDSLELKNDR